MDVKRNEDFQDQNKDQNEKSQDQDLNEDQEQSKKIYVFIKGLVENIMGAMTQMKINSSTKILMAMATTITYKDIYTNIIDDGDSESALIIKGLIGKHSIPCFLVMAHDVHQRLQDYTWRPNLTNEEMQQSFDTMQDECVNLIAKRLRHTCLHEDKPRRSLF